MFECVDLVVACAPHLGRHQVVDPHDQHVLVVRAVEHPDVAGGRQRGADPPQIVMCALLLGGHAEAGVPDALRIGLTDNVFDDSALSGGVHALQHQQHRAVVALLAVGVQHFLQLGVPLVALLLQRDGTVLVAGESRRAVGVDVGNLAAGAKLQRAARIVVPEIRHAGQATRATAGRVPGAVGRGTF